MKVYAGTSGFSYREWKGSFYPKGLPGTEMLAYYATRLGAVEINNTFYRLPRRELLARWRATVGPGFRFAIKASRRITHFARLGEKAKEPTEYLLRGVSVLGDALGSLLFQLPPNMRADPDRLVSFLGWLPEDMPVAFEFRHESWNSDRYRSLLRDHGVALVITEDDDSKEQAAFESTADWGYLRLRRAAYTDEELAVRAEKIGSLGWKHAFVFFKHEDEATGPRLARHFLELFE